MPVRNPTSAEANGTDHRSLAARPESVPTRMREYEPDEKLVPRPVWLLIRATVLFVVGDAVPRNGLDAKGLLGPLSQFFAWRISIGDTVEELVGSLTEENIARFVREVLARDLTAGTKGNYRSWLRRCAEAVNPTGRRFRPSGLHGAAPQAPYSNQEVTAWRHWARGLNTELRRVNADTLLALGLGGGFEANDIRLLRGTHVERRRENVLVHVEHARSPRTVPITSAWAHAIATAAVRAGDDYLFVPGRSATDRNVVSNFIARLPKLNGQILSASRLRTTWIVAHLTIGVSAPALLQAAGLASFGALDRYRPFLNPVSTDDVVRELGR